jgi:hypothetical protein
MRIILPILMILLLLPPTAQPQQVLRCTQVFADPQVAEPAAATPWQQLRPTRQITTAQSRSAPQSIALLGGAGPGPVTGQTIAVSAAATELYGTLYARFPSGLPATAAVRLTAYAGESLAATDAVFSATFINDGPSDVWRRFDWELIDASTVARLREAATATIALELLNVSSSTVWLDDLTANVCAPAATLSGNVTNPADPGANLTDATLLLARMEAGVTRVVATTRSDATGAYSFSGVPALGSAAAYQIWYTNTPDSVSRPANRLGFLAGPVIGALADGENRTGINLAINDIRLDAPAPNAAVVATNSNPVTLRWSGRVVAGELQQVCIYDPLRSGPANQPPPELCGPLLDPAVDQLSFDLSPASFAAAPNLGFAYGRSYRWYVRIVGPPTATGQPARFGRSFFERNITLLQQPASGPPANLPTPDPGLPAGAATPAEWTLLVYAALDNALSDPLRTPGTNRADFWVTGLRNLAARYPNVRIVTLLDRYGSTGVEWCYLPANAAPDCRTRPEANSADPALLADFVQQGLQRYPAQRAALVLIGPGHAIGGFGSDETSSNTPALSSANLATALTNATQAANRRLDLVLLQAPLMAEIDLVASLAPAADYLVATPDQIWQVNLFPGMLTLLSGPQAADPRNVAAGLTNTYAIAVNQAARGRAFVIQAFNLQQVGPVLTERENVAEDLRAALTADEATMRNLLDSARRAVQAYDASGNGRLRALANPAGASVFADEDAFVDLGALAAWLADELIVPGDVRASAAALDELLAGENSPVLVTRRQSGLGVAGALVDLSRARSPAIFLPAPARLGNQPTLSDLRLHRRAAITEWAALLRDLNAGALPGGGPAGVLEIAPGQSGLILPTGGIIGGTEVYLPVVRR